MKVCYSDYVSGSFTIILESDKDEVIIAEIPKTVKSLYDPPIIGSIVKEVIAQTVLVFVNCSIS